MTTIESLQFFADDPWGGIHEPCYPKGRRLYRDDSRFWVALDDDGQRLFFVTGTSKSAIKPVGELNGLVVSLDSMSSNNPRLVCTLTDRDPEIVRKFTIVAKEIAVFCRGCDDSHLFMEVHKRLLSWAKFLKPTRRGLDRSTYIGLLGELFVLTQHFIPTFGGKKSLEAWIGPDGKKQDFSWGGWALEIKTTLSGDKQTISISSLDQLHKVTDKLFLQRLVLAKADSGVSLRGMYDLVITSLSDDFLAESIFLQKISDLFGDASEEQLDQHFELANSDIFEVRVGFPSLTSETCPPGVTAATYEISLGSLHDFRFEGDLMTELLHV